jgi:hypothetical protein
MNEETFSRLGGRPDSEEGRIVYEATMGALVGVRRVLMLLSGLIGIFILNFFFWYLSWDKARLAGREGVIEVLERTHQRFEYYQDASQDAKIIEKMEEDKAKIESEIGSKTFELPLVGMPFVRTDFPVALLLSAAALLLWLLFYQRRLGACLQRLAQLRGWGVVLSALQYHFLLVGSHAAEEGRAAVKGLVYGLPILGSLHLVSDLYDLFVLSQRPVVELAFSSPGFLFKVSLRLLVDILLVVIVYKLANKCFREHQEAEQKLTRFIDVGESRHA